MSLSPSFGLASAVRKGADVHMLDCSCDGLSYVCCSGGWRPNRLESLGARGTDPGNAHSEMPWRPMVDRRRRKRRRHGSRGLSPCGYSWTIVRQPAGAMVTLADRTAATTSAKGLTSPGQYAFRAVASDGHSRVAREVLVNVFAGNQPPMPIDVHNRLTERW